MKTSFQTRIVIDEDVLKDFKPFLKAHGLLMGNFIGDAIKEKMEYAGELSYNGRFKVEADGNVGIGT